MIPFDSTEERRTQAKVKADPGPVDYQPDFIEAKHGKSITSAFKSKTVVRQKPYKTVGIHLKLYFYPRHCADSLSTFILCH